MATVIDLKDIEVGSLSNETLNLISRLTAEIRQVSGDSFSFNDPLLLPRIRRRVKHLRNPKLTALYHLFKNELLRSVETGHFGVRAHQRIGVSRNRYSSVRAISA